MGSEFSLPTQAWSWIYLEKGVPFCLHEGASNSKAMLLRTKFVLFIYPEVIYVLILGALEAQQCQPKIGLFFPVIHFLTSASDILRLALLELTRWRPASAKSSIVYISGRVNSSVIEYVNLHICSTGVLYPSLSQSLGQTYLTCWLKEDLYLPFWYFSFKCLMSLLFLYFSSSPSLILNKFFLVYHFNFHVILLIDFST